MMAWVVGRGGYQMKVAGHHSRVTSTLRGEIGCKIAIAVTVLIRCMEQGQGKGVKAKDITDITYGWSPVVAEALGECFGSGEIFVFHPRFVFPPLSAAHQTRALLSLCELFSAQRDTAFLTRLTKFPLGCKFTRVSPRSTGSSIKRTLLSSVTHVPSGLMGCASAALG